MYLLFTVLYAVNYRTKGKIAFNKKINDAIKCVTSYQESRRAISTLPTQKITVINANVCHGGGAGFRWQRSSSSSE